MVAFDPSANVAVPSALIVGRDRLGQLLKARVLVVCWAVPGEKIDAAGAPEYGVLVCRSFGGLVCWDESRISGRVSFEAVEGSGKGS